MGMCRPFRLPLALPGLLRRLRPRLGPLPLLPALLLLQGCQPLSGEVLHLYLVPTASGISGVSLDDSKAVAAPVLKAFNRL